MDNNTKTEFEEMYEALSEPIFRHCYFRVHNRDKAIELAQEVFLRTWDYIRKGNKVDNPKAFVYKVANNLIINEVMRKKESLSLDEMYEEIGFDPETSDHLDMIERIDANMLFEKLNDLTPSYREILFMRYVDGLSVAEIVELTRESESNISVRIHRGLKQLKKIYGGK